jgi:hypothetical protein
MTAPNTAKPTNIRFVVILVSRSHINKTSLKLAYGCPKIKRSNEWVCCISVTWV